MAFFSICPRSKRFLNYSVKAIPLTLVQDDGVEINPDFVNDVTKVSGGYGHFRVRSRKTDSFTVSVLIHKDDYVTGRNSDFSNESGNTVLHQDVSSLIDDGLEGYVDNEGNAIIEYGDPTYGTGNLSSSPNRKALDSTVLFSSGEYKKIKITTLLNYYMRHAMTFYIKSDGLIGAGGNHLYVITENKARKQTKRGYTVWDLTFTRFDSYKYPIFSKSNKGIKKAIKKLNAKKAKKIAAKTKLKTQLQKCDHKVMKYSKKQKTVKCVKVLQKFLNKNLGTKLKVDGWYGKTTVDAVKKFQNKYKKKYGLKPTGRINYPTYLVMTGNGKMVKNNKVITKNKAIQIGPTLKLLSG